MRPLIMHPVMNDVEKEKKSTLTPMLPLAVVILPTPTINTLTTHLDELNPPNTSLSTRVHAVIDVVRRDRKFVILERISDFKLIISCVSQVRSNSSS